MSPSNFADTAPLYRARGLSVVPIQPSTKKPAIGGWSGMHRETT